MRFTNLYSYARECSGELGPEIKTVEETVKSVVGPVNEKFRLVPDEIIRQTDIDQDHHRATHGTAVANVATVSKMAVRLYDKCETVTEQNVAPGWQKVKQSRVFHRLANAFAPKVAYYTEKYNTAVIGAAEKGCRASAYLPLVHKERIAEVFSEF